MIGRLSEVNHVTMELTPELQEKKIFLIEGLKRTYKGQYDAIQPLPYIKDRLYCVDKVFVEGGVEVCLAPEVTRGTGGSWERLESYKSIYTDFRFKSTRRIIQGEPGYGKSTLTLQLAYDWCNDVSDSPINNVEILILLRLRQLGSVKSLFRAIKSFLLFREPRVSKHEIEKIIRSCSSVHITLDGYDEYPGRGSDDNDYVHRIIKMELFADFDVSLTTRYLPESLRKETKRAKLTGFDDKARDEYIRKAVVGNNDEAVETIKQRLYENSILADLCQVPLIFVMFAHMAHDQRDFMKFKSVTQFFKHTIRCFYDHLKRKRKLYDDRNNRFYLHEMEHHELDKIAFEGLNKEHQQLSWIKTEFRKRVGPESYDQYILIGILVEEDVVSDNSTVDNVLFTTMVHFYHKLFCEWYAAHHLVTVVKSAVNLFGTLRFLDPGDLQYMFRFACGLDLDAGKILINHLKKIPGGNTFAILCILEQTGDFNDMDSVKAFCSRDVNIIRGDSALLQRSTTQLLEIASKNDIPISCLHLDYSSIKFEGDTIILQSGISLPILPTVEKIHIAGSSEEYENTEPSTKGFKTQIRLHPYDQSVNQETLTGMDILNWFRYGMKCRRIKELMFGQIQLPTSVSPESFTDIMKTRNIRVRWRPFDIDFHLDLQSGQWEVDDTQVLENIRSSTVSIDGRVLEQRSIVQLLHVANNHDISISCLDLDYSSIKFEGDSIILHSGISLPILPTVEKVQIAGSNQETLTEKDIINFFRHGIKCRRVKELVFVQLQLPTSISPEAFTDIMKTRNIQVRWRPFDIDFHLDLQNGHWEVDDTRVLENIRSSTVSINGSVLQQRSTVQLLHVAHRYNIPISSLLFSKSFKRADNGTIILNNGIQLTNLPQLEKIQVVDKDDCCSEITDRDIVNMLLSYNVICFEGCLLPVSFSSSSVTNTKISRAIKVSWCPFNIIFHLDMQTGLWEVDDTRVLENIRSSTVSIDGSVLQQRSAVQLLHVAHRYNIPMSCLHLEYSSIKIAGNNIILHSGISLPTYPTVEKILIAGSKAQHDNTETYPGISYRNQYRRPGIFPYGYFEHGYRRHVDAPSANQEILTENDILNWFSYGMKCRCVKELMFGQLQLPTSLSPEAFTHIMKTRNIKVRWRPFDIDFHLDLQNGHWEFDNMDTLRQLCSDTVYIKERDDILKQASTIMFISIASSHEIPISCLYLDKSFSKIYAGTLILESGLRLSCPVSVKKVGIDTSYEEREMTETEVVDILMFVQQSHMLGELDFGWCLLPQSIPAESILSILKSRNVKVTWLINYNLLQLNLQSGRWMRYGTKQEITDTEYSDMVRKFREEWRYTNW